MLHWFYESQMSTCPKDVTLEGNITIFLVITWIYHLETWNIASWKKELFRPLLGSRLHWKPTLLSWKLLQKLE